MGRTAITLGLDRAKNEWVLVAGPEVESGGKSVGVPIHKQLADLNAILSSGTHESFSRIVCVSTDGYFRKEHELSTKAEKAADEKRRADDLKKHEASVKAAKEKRQNEISASEKKEAEAHAKRIEEINRQHAAVPGNTTGK